MTTHQTTPKTRIVLWSKRNALTRSLRKRYRRCPNCGSRRLTFGVLCATGSSRTRGCVNPAPAGFCTECEATFQH